MIIAQTVRIDERAYGKVNTSKKKKRIAVNVVRLMAFVFSE